MGEATIEGREKPPEEALSTKKVESKTETLSEGRTSWKGETLKVLRTPLFVVEITAVGEKGKEVLAYTQRLGAIKESAVALIDKAIGSTQVNTFKR